MRFNFIKVVTILPPAAKTLWEYFGTRTIQTLSSTALAAWLVNLIE